MCIRIKGYDSEIKYNSKTPLEDQLIGRQEVIIKYDPKDPDMDRFLVEMERLCRQGISTNVKIDVVHNNFFKGIKAKKQISRLNKDLSLNEAIKILTNLQSTTDRVLEELSVICRK